MLKPKNYHGRAYAFLNCRKPKDEVAWIANDVKSFFATEAGLPHLDRMELKVNQTLTSLRKSKTVEDKTGLIRLVMEAHAAGMIYLKPGSVTISSGDVLCSHDFGNLYVIRASLSGVTNLSTADELAAIVNQMYNSPLYGEGEPFRGIIAYYSARKYHLRE